MYVLLVPMACGSAGAGGPGPAGAPAAVPGSMPGLDSLVALPGPVSGQVLLKLRTTGSFQDFALRAQVPHFTAAAALQAPVLQQVQRSVESDGTEQFLVSGLEPGRTLQFIVEAREEGGGSSLSPPVAARVPGRWKPARPADVIEVTQPGELDVEGAYYLLQNDVSSPGTAFRITARDVTFDLGGHTITYGTDQDESNGVFSTYLYNRGRMTVLNGVIRQAGSRSGCDAIHFRGGHDVRLSQLTTTVQGPDCDGINLWDGFTGDVRVDHCTVACNTTVVGNRHSPGVAALRLEGATQSAEIDANLITASPQWGLKLSATETRGSLLIHHNRILGTHARVANGYMIGVHQPGADVFENELAGESRGIHLDGIDAHGHGAHIHDNSIRAQDQPNSEFPTHWCHGIKVEGPVSAWIYDNAVWVGADALHSEARALDLSMTGSKQVVIQGNRFAGVSQIAGRDGLALAWTDGFDSAAAAGGLVLEHNVFVATDRFLQRAWESRTGAAFYANLWVRDLRLGSAHPFVFERFDNEEGIPSPGHGLVDCLTSENALAVSQWASPGPYTSERSYSLAFEVHDAAGQPVVGAGVRVFDAASRLVLSKATDGQGRARGTVLVDRITSGPTLSGQGPFRVDVSKSGVGQYLETVSVRGRVALHIDLTAGRGVQDDQSPAAPAAAGLHRVSATRLLLDWQDAGDDSGIAGYIVFLDGVEAAFCPSSPCLLSAVAPGKSHTIQVQAIDLAGLRSPLGAATSVAAVSEDRGP